MEHDLVGLKTLPLGSSREVWRGDRICAYVEPQVKDSGVLAQLHGRDLEVYQRWADFRLNMGTAEAAICAIAALQGPVWRDVIRLRTRAGLAILVITAYTRANARALARVDIDDLLFLDEVSGDALTTAIAGITRRATTRLAAAALRQNSIGLDTELAETLARACASQRLVRTVDELSRLMGYSRSTLTRRWQRHMPPESHPHLFLEWLLLMHGLILRSRTGRSWARVAEALGVKRQTLADSCRRLFGVTPVELEHLERVRLIGKLWEIVGRWPRHRHAPAAHGHR